MAVPGGLLVLLVVQVSVVVGAPLSAGRGIAGVSLPPNVEGILSGIQTMMNTTILVTPAVLKQIFDEPAISSTLLDPTLTYRQRSVIYTLLLQTVPAQSRNALLDLLPNTISTVQPASSVLDVAGTDDQVKMAKLLPQMLPSQKLALFIAIMADRSSVHKTLQGPERLGTFLSEMKDVPYGLAILLQNVNPTDFKTIFNDFNATVAPLEFEKRLEMANSMPKSLLRAWYEESPSSLWDEPQLLALMCKDLDEISDFSQLRNLVGNYTEARRRSATSPFPRALLYCFRDRLTEELANRRQNALDSNAALLTFLTHSDIRKFGGNVLASIKMDHFTELGTANNDEVVTSVLKEMAMMPITDIMTSITAKKAAEIAEFIKMQVDSLKSGSADEKYGIDDLAMFGSYLYFAPDVLERAAADATKEFVTSFLFENVEKVGCMPESSRDALRRAIFRDFGEPNTWDLRESFIIGDLMIILRESDLLELSPIVMFHAVPSLVQNNQYNRHLKEAPIYTKETLIAKVCREWLMEDGDSFYDSYTILMNSHLQVVQTRVDRIREAVQSIPNNQPQKRSIDDQHLVQPLHHSHSVHKRQAGSVSDDVTEDEFFRRLIESKLATTRFAHGMVAEMNHKMFQWGRRDTFRVARLYGIVGYPGAGTVSAAMIEGLKERNQFTESDHDLKHIDETTATRNKRLLLMVVEFFGLTHDDFDDVTRDKFCAFFDTVCSSPFYEYRVLMSKAIDRSSEANFINRVPTITPYSLSTTITCFGLMTATAGGIGAVMPSTDFLRSWSPVQLGDCIDVIGAMDWSPEQKQTLWNKLIANQIPQELVESLPYLNAIALNTFLEVAVRENLNILNLKFPEALETLSIIGEKEYSLETLTSIADKVRSDTEMSLAPNSASIPGLLLYGSLKHITCGTEPSELKAVLEVPNVARYLLPILGTVKSCPNPLALELMANSSLTTFGEPDTWEPSTVQSLGIIVGGLRPDDMAKLKPCCVAALTPAAIRHLKFDHLNSMTSKQISMLAPEALSGIHRSHLMASDEKVLAPEQWQPLGRILASTEEEPIFNKLRKDMIDLQEMHTNATEVTTQEFETKDNETVNAETDEGAAESEGSGAMPTTRIAYMLLSVAFMLCLVL